MGNQLNLPETNNKKYGWKRDIPDQRDQYKLYPDAETDSYVMNTDLRSKCPPIYNQGKLGSCTANAIAGAFEYNELKQFPNNPVMPSRLFIYYNERLMEHTVNSDSGASIRDGMKTINTDGVCPESEWPYDIDKFTTKPTSWCYELAEAYKTIEYKKIKQTLGQLKKCLEDNYPIICGISVYESFESNTVAETGLIPIPDISESLLGGHAVMLVGYDDNDEKFILRNSWGTNWGDEGYGYIPYDYIVNDKLASDFWIIEKIQEPDPNLFSYTGETLYEDESKDNNDCSKNSGKNSGNSDVNDSGNENDSENENNEGQTNENNKESDNNIADIKTSCMTNSNTTNISENDSDTNDSHISDESKSKSDSELY